MFKANAVPTFQDVIYDEQQRLPKVKLDLKGVRQYAREKGVAIASLTDAEKELFMEA